MTDTTDTSRESRLDGETSVPLTDIDADWTRYFRYQAAYRDQVDAIEQFLTLLSDQGYYLFEGACGTGKSLAALTGSLHAVRNRDRLAASESVPGDEFPAYDRVFVATPVKQQMAQFVEEMHGINRRLPAGEPAVPTVVLRGRSDMEVYRNTDVPTFDRQELRDRLDDFRKLTRRVISFDSEYPIDWPAEMDPPAYSRHDYDWETASLRATRYREQYQYDPARAQAIVHRTRNFSPDRAPSDDRLTIRGVETPYPEVIPHTRELADRAVVSSNTSGQLPTQLQGKIDPFYAGFFAHQDGFPIGFHDADQSVFDGETLVEQAASRGICPHQTMSMLASEATVVLGNYNHLFDPQTRVLTEGKLGILDEETIVVVDEAHRIEGRVRDMLSASVDIYTLDRAIRDVAIVSEYADANLSQTPTPDITGQAAQKLSDTVVEALHSIDDKEVTVDDLREVETLFKAAKDFLEDRGQRLLQSSSQTPWQQTVDTRQPEDINSGIMTAGQDVFRQTVCEYSDVSDETFQKALPVMSAVGYVYDLLGRKGIYDRTPQGRQVGVFFDRWATADRVAYHREFSLDANLKESVPDNYPDWVRGWTPRLQLFNCVPREELQDVFRELGGGALMSATVQPADVFTEAVGIDRVLPPDPDRRGADQDPRPTTFDQFPLRFPPANRMSIAVDIPKYTNSNRGTPVTDQSRMTPTRKQYADVILDVARSEGNILVAMPSYREAEWAHDYVNNHGIDKRLHLDQSSTDQETTATLESFFADGDAVIFTSTRGTITEGVDFDGQKLHGCMVVGIPILPTQTERMQAIKDAYDEQIDTTSGFEAALTVPAVRKSRQTIGRVVRGASEVGFRVLCDERYLSTDWAGVNSYLSELERAEFTAVKPDQVSARIDEFWKTADHDQTDRSETVPIDSDTSGSDSVSPPDTTSSSTDQSASPLDKIASQVGTVTDEQTEE